MPITRSDLADIFRHHAPNSEQIEQYQRIREAGKLFASVVLDNTPPSPDQTVAIRKIREAVMTANAAVALGGKF